MEINRGINLINFRATNQIQIKFNFIDTKPIGLNKWKVIIWVYSKSEKSTWPVASFKLKIRRKLKTNKVYLIIVLNRDE